jgi:CRISPR-associated protein Csm5
MLKYKLKVKITTLSPVHIGTGKSLREGIDFIKRDGYIWIANQGKIFDFLLGERLQSGGRLSDKDFLLAKTNLGDIQLPPEAFDLAKNIFHYRVKGNTSTTNAMGDLAEQIKELKDQPYLPGSSLKGALRSSVLRHLTIKYEKQAPLEVKYPENRRADPDHAADIMEIKHFMPPDFQSNNKNPHYDFWRAVQVSDFLPIKTIDLILANAIVFPAKNANGNPSQTIPLDLEMIPENVEFSGEISLDRFLYEDQRASEFCLSTDRPEDFPTKLKQILDHDFDGLMKANQTFFDALSKSKDKEIIRLSGLGQSSLDYLKRVKGKLLQNEMILPIGHGTGWRSKTLGTVLEERLSPKEFNRMVREFKLGKGNWKQGEVFPQTRYIVSTPDHSYALPGWVKLEMSMEKPK